MADTEIRKGYVEAALNAESEKAWDAYLSIDVKAKNGDEIISEKLSTCLKNTTQFLGLEKFFEQNSDSEVLITDDVISLKDEHDIYTLIRAIIGKDVWVHLRVDANRVQSINEYLYKVAKEEAHEGMALIKWRYSDDQYLVELMKRLPDRSEYILRFYEDGNGVIIFSDFDWYRIFYFKVKDHLREQLITNISKKIDEIVVHPTEVCEDDRCRGFSVHLKYNLEWKYPEAKKRLKNFQKFESIEYSNDENKMKIAKQLLSAPEIKEMWMKMHLQEYAD